MQTPTVYDGSQRRCGRCDLTREVSGNVPVRALALWAHSRRFVSPTAWIPDMPAALALVAVHFHSAHPPK